MMMMKRERGSLVIVQVRMRHHKLNKPMLRTARFRSYLHGFRRCYADTLLCIILIQEESHVRGKLITTLLYVQIIAALVTK